MQGRSNFGRRYPLNPLRTALPHGGRGRGAPADTRGLPSARAAGQAGAPSRARPNRWADRGCLLWSASAASAKIQSLEQTLAGHVTVSANGGRIAMSLLPSLVCSRFVLCTSGGLVRGWRNRGEQIPAETLAEAAQKRHA